MAKAKRISAQKEWAPAVELQLSDEEAQVLRDVIGGSIGATGRGELLSQICHALDSGGYGRSALNDFKGSITFIR